MKHLAIIMVMASASALVLGAQSPAQQPPPFRAGVDIAKVTVRVLDGTRRPVRDLGMENFTVLLDGEPRRVVAVDAGAVVEPGAPPAPWFREIAPDVTSNVVERPRLVVIIMDDGLIPGDRWVLNTAKQIGRATIDALRPSDLAAVVFTRDNRRPTDFTADRSRLLAAVERTNFGDPRRFVGASFSTLKYAISYLRETQLPSMIVYITMGWPDPVDSIGPKIAGLTTTDLPDREESLEMRLRFGETLSSAQQAGIPIYAVSPLGLTAPTPVFSNPVLGIYRPTAAGISAETAREMALTLRSISMNSGGRAVIHSNTPAEMIPAIFLENSLYYTIGYEVPRSFADNRYHRLQVKVDRDDAFVQPGDERMFRAVPASAPPAGTEAITHALSGIVPLADEPVQLTVTTLAPRTSDGSSTATVALAIGLETPAAAPEDAKSDEFAVVIKVFDLEGRREVASKSDGFRIGRRNTARPFDFLTTIAVPPGHFNLRVAVKSVTRNRSGSVYTEISAPDYSRLPFSASEIVITGPARRPSVPVTAVGDVLPIVPTTARTFASQDDVRAFTRLHWSGAEPQTARMTTTIADAFNRNVFARAESVEAPPATTGRARSRDYLLSLPVGTLAPGVYLLTFRAAPDRGDEIIRHVRFTVEGKSNGEPGSCAETAKLCLNW